MLGAGRQRRDGWMTLDANPKVEADFTALIPPLPAAVQAIRWDEIEWIHGITSLYPWDAEILLKELHSVLEPGGKLILEQPHFYSAIENVEWLFGDPRFADPLHMNHWAYTPDTLAALLKSAGFSTIDLLSPLHHNPARDFRLEAYT